MQTNTIGVVKENFNLQQKGFYTLKSFKKGDTLMKFSARQTLQHPNYLTLQVSTNEHILLSPLSIQYINHSCNPNVFFNTTTFTLEALKDIAIDDELTFFYPSTEWKMQQPFSCNCGSTNCLNTIQGAYYLNTKQLLSYKFTDFIQQQLADIQITKRA